MSMDRWVSILGIVVILVLAWGLSSARTKLKWQPVVGGLLLQITLAVLILKTPWGQQIFAAIGQLFVNLLDCVNAGSSFVFGKDYGEHFFAFKVAPTIIFFSALTSVLYYLRVIQPVVAGFGWLMRKTMRVTGAESLATAANVFIGHTEAPLVVRPYLSGMTRSELMAVMVGGFASVSGGVLGAYVDLGIDAGHLVCASVISAPAALALAKIVQPETDVPEPIAATFGTKPAEGNVIEAAAKGASDGVKLALNVTGMLIAFLALIALVNLILGSIGTRIGVDLSLELILGYAFAPLAWVMGIPGEDCMRAGELLGLKMVGNEIIAYERLGEWLQADSGVTIQNRTEVIMTYALCGFSNFGAIAIQIAGIGGLAPERRKDIASLGLRAMLAGSLACMMTGCIAGLLIS